jgi:cell wall-associated NlpC family hydrolase
VHKTQGVAVPRTAAQQFEAARKINQSEVQKGDLIFFDSGAGISHVGLIISEKNEPLVMIHASTSKGIVITEIEKTIYWLKKIAGFGTFVN